MMMCEREVRTMQCRVIRKSGVHTSREPRTALLDEQKITAILSELGFQETDRGIKTRFVSKVIDEKVVQCAKQARQG